MSQLKLDMQDLQFGSKYEPVKLKQLMNQLNAVTRFNQKLLAMLRAGTAGQVLVKIDHQDLNATWGEGGGSGTGIVESIVAGTNVTVDATDPANPIVSSAGEQGEQGPPGTDGTDGAAGEDGSSVLSGSGAPGVGVGVDGDFYIDTDVFDIYGPKTGGVWGAGTSLIGPAGADGADGLMTSVVAGTRIDVDATDPANPIVSVDVATDAFLTAAEAATLLTEDDETATFPNSRQLLAGTNVAFDDTTPGQRTISATGGSGGAGGALLHAGW